MDPIIGRGDPDCVRPMDLMKSFMVAYVLGDDDGFLELIHPDALFVFPGSPKEIPWAGSWRGRDMQRFLDIVKDSLHFLEYRPVEFIQVDDERVVVRMWELVRARSTGITHDNRHIGLATVRGGLVVEWQEYSDTAGQRSLFVEP
ncbi:MAG: hypothetical protein RIT28_1687 [Pseudomonadota bacterium]|jgi:ketosteroid isomerase-like protein